MARGLPSNQINNAIDCMIVIRQETADRALKLWSYQELWDAITSDGKGAENESV